MSVYVCGCGGGRFEGKEGAGGEKRRCFVIVLQWLILVVSACDQNNHGRKTFLDKSLLKVHHKSSLLHLPPLPTTLTNPTTFTNHTHTTCTPHTLCIIYFLWADLINHWSNSLALVVAMHNHNYHSKHHSENSHMQFLT